MSLLIIIDSAMVNHILRLLRKYPQGLSLDKLAREMDLTFQERPRLRQALQRLENKGLVVKSQRRFILRAQSRLVSGRLVSVSRGFGFVRPESDIEHDIFIPARFSGGAVYGDRVELALMDGDTLEGRILRVLERGSELETGVIKERSGQTFFLSYLSPRADEEPVLCPPGLEVRPGMIVDVERTTRVVQRVLGNPDSPGVDVAVITGKYRLSTAFSSKAASEAAQVTRSVTASDRQGRCDYRRWTAFTIDGEDARDFDDAVSIEKRADGSYRLGVHIADVSHYVPEGSALDREAYQRGCSVYFPETVLPMLPETLSMDICSLRPGRERLTMSAILDLNAEGEKVTASFHPSVIRSAARLTYAEVYRLFQGGDPPPAIDSGVAADLLLMRELAAKLRRRRVQAGSLDFNLPELRIHFRDGIIHDIEVFKANEAHGVVEEFMIAANEAVAVFLDERLTRVLYRIHPPPAPEALGRLRRLLEGLGISLPPSRKLGVKDLQSVQAASAGTPFAKFVMLQVLKSLKPAAYSPDNPGHYGLGKASYTHFTSPIRRYPDLVLHRLLKRVLQGAKIEGGDLGAVATHCSQQERLVEEAERELSEWRVFRYLRGRMGDVFSGFVVDISKAGLTVELEDFLVTGIVFYSDLPGDFYRRTPLAAVGRRSGRRFALGDSLKVVVAAVDPDLRRLTLVPES